MEVAAVAEYVIQACDAVAEAHAMGIVHRDLKPANLFLTHRPDGGPLVKVLDFGISKATALNGASLGLTKTGSILGSPYYMSPEQMKSSKDVDARSDVWSVGVILYQLLTARLPFESDTLGGLMAKVLQEEPLALSAQRSDVPPQVAGIVTRCLQRERSQRAASVAEVALALAPHAPPRAQPIAERIAALLGAVGTVPDRSAVPGGGVPSIPVLATSQALGGSQAALKKRATVALAVVAVLGVIGYLGFGARQILGSQRGTMVGIDATSVPSVDSAKLPPTALVVSSKVGPNPAPSAATLTVAPAEPLASASSAVAPPASATAGAAVDAHGAPGKKDAGAAPVATHGATATAVAPEAHTTQARKRVLDERN